MCRVLLLTILLSFSVFACDLIEPVYPSPTPTARIWPTYVPTTPTPYPTVAYTPVAYKGLGVSRSDMKVILDGYTFTRMNDRTLATRGSTDVILVDPVHDLSKVHILFSAYSDVNVVLDLTALAIVINPALGDLEWIFDGFIAGKTKVSKVNRNIKITGESFPSGTIAITFEPS